MEYHFKILDNKFNPVTNASVTLATIQGQPIQTTQSEYGLVTVWTDQDPATRQVIIEAPGFKTTSFTLTAFIEDSETEVVLERSFQAWQLMLVIAAVAIYRKKSGKIGALGTGDIFPIFMLIAGLLGFDLIKKILEWLGIWESKENKALDTAASDPGSFWNPNWWLTIKPADKQWSYAISEATASEWLIELIEAMSAINDCEECAIAIFKRCRTQANCSFLAWVFQKYYGEDLLTWLRGGWWPQDRLSDADVYTITQYISQLPKY
jgi:hypothetical protein